MWFLWLPTCEGYDPNLPTIVAVLRSTKLTTDGLVEPKKDRSPVGRLVVWSRRFDFGLRRSKRVLRAKQVSLWTISWWVVPRRRSISRSEKLWTFSPVRFWTWNSCAGPGWSAQDLWQKWSFMVRLLLQRVVRHIFWVFWYCSDWDWLICWALGTLKAVSLPCSALLTASSSGSHTVVRCHWHRCGSWRNW